MSIEKNTSNGQSSNWTWHPLDQSKSRSPKHTTTNCEFGMPDNFQCTHGWGEGSHGTLAIVRNATRGAIPTWVNSCSTKLFKQYINLQLSYLFFLFNKWRFCLMHFYWTMRKRKFEQAWPKICQLTKGVVEAHHFDYDQYVWVQISMQLFIQCCKRLRI